MSLTDYGIIRGDPQLGFVLVFQGVHSNGATFRIEAEQLGTGWNMIYVYEGGRKGAWISENPSLKEAIAAYLKRLG